MKKRRNTCCSSFEIPPYIYIFPENLFQLNFIREKGKKKSHRFLSFILPKFRDSNSEKTELFRSPHHLSVEFALPRDSSSRIILFSYRRGISYPLLSRGKKKKNPLREREKLLLSRNFSTFPLESKKKKEKKEREIHISRMQRTGSVKAWQEICWSNFST